MTITKLFARTNAAFSDIVYYLRRIKRNRFQGVLIGVILHYMLFFLPVVVKYVNRGLDAECPANSSYRLEHDLLGITLADLFCFFVARRVVFRIRDDDASDMQMG